MKYFLLGVVVGWVIEWLLYQIWWKPGHHQKGSSGAGDFSQERKRLSNKIIEKDAEISHMKARIAMLEERGPRSRSVTPEKQTTVAAPKVATPKAATPKTAAKKTETKKPAARKAVAAKPKASKKPDDLKKVSGVGPKIAGLLKDDGIDTFAKLGKTDSAKIQAILKKAGPRYALADVSSWSEQAQLLDEGKLDALELLQASLKK